jgi:hypothetical protein
MGNPKGILVLFCTCLLCAYRNLKESSVVSTTSIFADAFVAPSPVAFTRAIGGRARKVTPALSAFGDNNNNDDETSDNDNDINKFDMAQRIESLKSVVLGALSGGIAVTPIAYLHYVATSPVANIAQWEFVTDMSSLQAALFAIVYRYAVRANDNNPMLNQGVVGGFVVVRTLSNIQVTDTCLSIPLRCKWDSALFHLFSLLVLLRQSDRCGSQLKSALVVYGMSCFRIIRVHSLVCLSRNNAAYFQSIPST